MAQATIALESTDGARRVVLGGDWQLVSIVPRYRMLVAELGRFAAERDIQWDLSAVGALDSVGALMLWRAWGRQLPPHVHLRPELVKLFQYIERAKTRTETSAPPRSPLAWIMAIGRVAIRSVVHVRDGVRLVGQLVLDSLRLLREPGEIPWREISANVHKAGVMAMPVSALVGFLIGVVLSYLSALQLRSLGGDVYIINLLGIGIVREIGPTIVAVLVAGRSGSAMTAQIGTMRVTEELDALATMGVSRTRRLVFPKVVALAIAMPLLVLWTSAVALLGGMLSASVQLDLDPAFFLASLPKVVAVSNLWLALAKGVTFGMAIALVACHFGLRVRPNTESLSSHTTSSVVAAITIVIVVDAIFAVMTRHVGLPG